MNTTWIYKATPFLGKYCIPNDLKNLVTYFKIDAFKNYGSQTMQGIADISTCVWVIFGSLFIALILGFIYMYVAKHFIGLIVWVLIGGILVL